MLKKLLKFLHEIGAVGVLGSFAACIVLTLHAPSRPLAASAAARLDIATVTQWLLVPSLAIVLVSGLLAIAATPAYVNAGWPWLKAMLGIGLFEGTLVTVSGGARRAAELSAAAAAGSGDPAELAQVLHSEWNALWVLLTMSVANVAIAVWRPRLQRAAE